MTDRTPFPSLELPADEPPAGGQPVIGQPIVRQPPSVVQCQSALEKDFPRILTTIQSLWGYPELNTYFRKLTLDNRGDRDGFPKEAWEEIFTLLYLHQVIVPEPLY